MITVPRNPIADTRTCDYTKVTKDELYVASDQHIQDVGAGLELFRDLLDTAAEHHDADKLSDIDSFHADLLTGFQQTGWWDRHRQKNRHHLLAADGVPVDVNLIDVLDFIADMVMARAARGADFPIELPSELLQTAFKNTVDLLQRQVVVEEA